MDSNIPTVNKIQASIEGLGQYTSGQMLFRLSRNVFALGTGHRDSKSFYQVNLRDKTHQKSPQLALNSSTGFYQSFGEYVRLF